MIYFVFVLIIKICSPFVFFIWLQYESQTHNLNEFLLAESKLHDKTLILIDDVNFSNGGKAKMTHEYLEKNNYILIHKNQQSLWTKNV